MGGKERGGERQLPVQQAARSRDRWWERETERGLGGWRREM